MEKGAIPMQQSYDVVIIGGGVVGSAIARELSRYKLRIAVLENVMNPTNIGAIFRCAAALGMDAVLLTAAGSDPLYRAQHRYAPRRVPL